jgi:hypothetical protein
LALVLWVGFLAFKCVGCAHDAGYLVSDFTERFSCNPTRQIETITGSALGADESAAIVLVVPPEPVLPLTDRARSMLIDKVAAVYP